MQEECERSGELLLNGSEVQQLRHALHELSNLLTGILVSGGLVQQGGAGESRMRYMDSVCESGERGAMLVREVRAMFAAALERDGYVEDEPGEPWSPAKPEESTSGDQVHEA